MEGNPAFFSVLAIAHDKENLLRRCYDADGTALPFVRRVHFESRMNHAFAKQERPRLIRETRLKFQGRVFSGFYDSWASFVIQVKYTIGFEIEITLTGSKVQRN